MHDLAEPKWASKARRQPNVAPASRRASPMLGPTRRIRRVGPKPTTTRYGERLAEKMSEKPLVSPDTRLLANESNTKNENAGAFGLPLKRKLEPLAKPFGCADPWM